MTVPESSLITTEYRNTTHTDLSLQWDNHHDLAAKVSVINNLLQWVKTVCSTAALRRKKTTLKKHYRAENTLLGPKQGLYQMLNPAGSQMLQ